MDLALFCAAHVPWHITRHTLLSLHMIEATMWIEKMVS